jgi:cell division transport system permease protein
LRILLRMAIEISRAVRHETLSTLGTLLTIFLAMSLPGALWIISDNLSDMERELRSGVTMDVFLADGLTSDELNDLQARILDLDGVLESKYLSKQDALFKMRETFGLDMIQDIDENPFPASIILKIDEPHMKPGASDSLAAEISSLPGVDDVVFAGEMLERLGHMIDSVRALGFSIAFLVCFSAIFIVGNTVRIAITDRRKAVEIMQLVGATRSYILTPFVLLGGLLGLFGALLAAFCLWFATGFISRHLVEIAYLDVYDALAFVLAGLLLGMTGALVATRRFLEV